MIVASEKEPVKASVVRFDNTKAQLATEAGGFSLSAETDDDSKVDKRQVDVDHSDAAYLANNLSGLSTRTLEERDSAEGWADDSAWERESPPIAPAASDALDKIREMRQILEGDPNLKETLSRSESMSNKEKIANPYIFPRTSSNALDALRSVRMQLESNKDVAKAVSDTLYTTPRVGIPPRTPSKAKRSAGRFFKKSSPNDSSVSPPESSSIARQEKENRDGAEEERGDDRSVPSLVGPPPPPPPPSTQMTRSTGSAVRVPDEPFVSPPDQSLQSPKHEEQSHPNSDDAVREGNIQGESSVLSRQPAKGKLSLKKFFKKRGSKREPDQQPLMPQDSSSPSEDNNQEVDDAEEEDVQDPSVEVVLKGYVAPETEDEFVQTKTRRRGVKQLFKKLGRKNKTETPDLTPEDDVEGEDAGGQVDKGENFPRVFSSDSFIDEKMHACRADEEDDDDSTGVAPSSGFFGAADMNNKITANDFPSRDLFAADKGVATSPEPFVDASDFNNAFNIDSIRSTVNIDVKEIERKMKQKRATDASVSSSRGPASLAGTAGKKVGQLSSTASVKSSRTRKNVMNSKNRQRPNTIKKKPAIYQNGKLAGNAGTTQRADQGKLRDDNQSFTRWPQN